MKARRDRFGPTPGQAKAEVRLQKLPSLVTCSPWQVFSFWHAQVLGGAREVIG